MKPIKRGRGTTRSERYLAKIADRTFLDLWSYPNTFNDRRSGGVGPGKELVDLLVVCGDDVILFSDKAIAWPAGDDTALCWSRWYRRAVAHSIDQIRGAERWLRLHPDRIFTDASCTSRLPLDLPTPDRMRVHGVAIALGAQEAAGAFQKRRRGAMVVNSLLKGAAHTDAHSPLYMPFAFGDVNPDGIFVHVFDETALDIVMREMDTISDFAGYLSARANAIRDVTVAMAPSEADLLATYQATDIGDGQHGFLPVEAYGGHPNSWLVIPEGEYNKYLALPERRAKLTANKISYAWDRLIKRFTQHVLAGTSVMLADIEPDQARAERALRAMALEDRTRRRALATAFVGALHDAARSGQERFARVVFPIEGSPDPECGHVFLIVQYAPWMRSRGYEAYRRMRAGMLQIYCQAALYEQRHLKRMLGIALDGRGAKGGSEDIMLVQVDEWTPEEEARVNELRLGADILVPGRLKAGHLSTSEFPDVSRTPRQSGNRHARRASKAQRTHRR